MKKVLITLDFDPSSKKVAEQGYALAKAMNAQVILLHVVADSLYYSPLIMSTMTELVSFNSAEFIQTTDEKGIKKAAQYYLDKVKIQLDDEAIKTKVETGDFADVILETANHLHADIIVMGSHSRKWLEEIIMGSVTDKVLRNTKIPLFIVPTKKQK